MPSYRLRCCVGCVGWILKICDKQDKTCINDPSLPLRPSSSRLPPRHTTHAHTTTPTPPFSLPPALPATHRTTTITSTHSCRPYIETTTKRWRREHFWGSCAIHQSSRLGQSQHSQHNELQKKKETTSCDAQRWTMINAILTQISDPILLKPHARAHDLSPVQHMTRYYSSSKKKAAWPTLHSRSGWVGLHRLQRFTPDRSRLFCTEKCFLLNSKNKWDAWRAECDLQGSGNRVCLSSCSLYFFFSFLASIAARLLVTFLQTKKTFFEGKNLPEASFLFFLWFLCFHLLNFFKKKLMFFLLLLFLFCCLFSFFLMFLFFFIFWFFFDFLGPAKKKTSKNRMKRNACKRDTGVSVGREIHQPKCSSL